MGAVSREAGEYLEHMLALAPEQARAFYRSLSPPAFAALLARSRHDLGATYGFLQRDPVGFVEDVLRVGTWSAQRQLLGSLSDHERTASVACHAPGKTLTAAAAVLHWGSVWPLGTAQVVTTAPRMRQVKHIMWPYIRRLHNQGRLPGVVQMTQWKVGDEIVGYGFCYDAETEILTRDGWKSFADVTLGDEVATRSPSGEFQWQHPRHVTWQRYAGPMVKFRSQVFDLLVTPNHRMLVRRSDDWKVRPLMLREAGWFAEKPTRATSWRIPSRSVWRGTDPEWFDVPAVIGQHRGRRNAPAVRIPAKVWAVLLGWFIAEGWVDHRGKSPSTIEICQASTSPHLEQIADVLNQSGLKWWYRQGSRPGSGRFVVSHRALADWLRVHCYEGGAYSEHKRIPDEAKEWSPVLLDALIGALIDGDGHVEPSGLRRYITVSRRLADDLLEVGQKAGEEPWMDSFQPTNGIGRLRQYRVAFRPGDEHGVPTPTTEDYDGWIGCVTTPNGVVYVRRRGRTAWCGNSAEDYAEDAFQGIHARNVLLVVDEAGGISHTLGRSYMAVLSNPNARLFMIGNAPVDEEGSWFEEQCEKTTELVHTIRIPASETPNFTGERTPRCTICPAGTPPHRVATHLTTHEWVDEVTQEFGEESAYVQARVHATFPVSVGQKVMPYGWVEACADADHEPAEGNWVRVGADIAAEGGDEFVIARSVGFAVRIVHRSSGAANADPVNLAGRILEEVREACDLRQQLGEERRVHVKIDASGMGWGVAGLVKRQVEEAGLPALVFPIRGEDPPNDETQFRNCLTGDALVLPVGDLRHVFRGWSDGPFYRVKMASGDEFTATAHHNVLTRSGWTEVHRLNVGDQLVKAGWGDRRSPEPQEGQVPATIGEVYRAACLTGQKERVEGARMNFHGDRLVGDVDVVVVDGHLHAVDPPGRQHGNHEPFVGGLPRQRPFAGARGVGHAPNRDLGDMQHMAPQASLSLRTTVGIEHMAAVAGGLVPALHVGLGEDLIDVIGGEAIRFPSPGGAVARPVEVEDAASRGLVKGFASQGVSLGLGTYLDALFGEPSPEGSFIAPGILGERVQRLAGQVPVDQVASVKVLPGRGQWVYTLGTSTGAYASSTTIHRNCRSELWWNMRRLVKPDTDPTTGAVIRPGRVKFVDAPTRLLAQLSAPKYATDAAGRIIVEKKKDTKGRIGGSPDLADAANLAVYEPAGGGGPARLEAPPQVTMPTRISQTPGGGTGQVIPLRPPAR